MFISPLLKSKLEKAPVWALSVYAALTSFGVYFCMYAFRKPFTAAGFERIAYLNIDYKVFGLASFAELLYHLQDNFPS